MMNKKRVNINRAYTAIRGENNNMNTIIELPETSDNSQTEELLEQYKYQTGQQKKYDDDAVRQKKQIRYREEQLQRTEREQEKHLEYIVIAYVACFFILLMFL